MSTPTGNVQTVSDIDANLQKNKTYSYLSTLIYGVDLNIISVYDELNKVYININTQMSYDKTLGNIKINTTDIRPNYNRSYVITGSKPDKSLIYINNMRNLLNKTSN
jgi:hypothetical protein